jgi:hypothetical protein
MPRQSKQGKGLGKGPWPLAPGPWPLAPGPWPLAPGPWPLAPGPMHTHKAYTQSIHTKHTHLVWHTIQRKFEHTLIFLLKGLDKELKIDLRIYTI